MTRIDNAMRSAVWCFDGAANLWTIKIKSLYMLWSQYKLEMMRHSEFLHKQITGIPILANRNSNFLTFQTSEFQKKNPTKIFGIRNKIGIQLPMGIPGIGTKNWNSQPRQGYSHAIVTVGTKRHCHQQFCGRSYCQGSRTMPGIVGRVSHHSSLVLTEG